MTILKSLVESNPFTQDWKVPTCKTTKDVLKYMIAQQQVYYEKTILDEISYMILLRNIKLLIKEYGKESVLRGIVQSLWVSDFPFSTKLIREMLERYDDSSTD